MKYYLNNGTVMNVPRCMQAAASITRYVVGLADNSEAATWINLMAYITDDMTPHYDINPYGLLNALTSEDTHENHKWYIDNILANGAFVWGDIYHGGLYVYKWKETGGVMTYGIALFCGYGVSESDDTRDIFYIKNYAQFYGISEAQMTAFTMLEFITRDPETGLIDTDIYVMCIGEMEDNGITYTLESFGEPQVDLTGEIRSVSYATQGMSEISLSTTLVDAQQITVNPLNPLYVNYTTPYQAWTAQDNNDFYYRFSQDVGTVGYAEDPDYKQQGTWQGGKGNLVTEDPQNGSTNSTGGGGGIPSKQSDDCGFPSGDQFNIDATTSGFLTIFHPSAAEMAAFNQWLFSSFTQSWWDQLKKIMADPMDFIIGAGMIKYTPTQKTQSAEIKFGGIGSEVFAETINQWEEIDMKSVTVNEQYETYMDYVGYSSAKIFLPFIGIMDLDINDVMGATLTLKYYIDNLTGSCVALLNSQRADRGSSDDSHINSVLYKFTGNAMQQLPIYMKDYTQAVSAAIDLIGSGISAASTESVPSFGRAAGDVLQMHPTVQRSGSLGSNFGMIDYLKPYLILTRPIRSIPADMNKREGNRASFTAEIGSFKGFVKALDGTNWARNIHATEDEKDEIQKYLTDGIIIADEFND